EFTKFRWWWRRRVLRRLSQRNRECSNYHWIGWSRQQWLHSGLSRWNVFNRWGDYNPSHWRLRWRGYKPRCDWGQRIWRITKSYWNAIKRQRRRVGSESA